MYLRLVERPRESRVRVKQTLAPLPFVKLKPILDLSANPRWQSPVRFRVDVKLFDCLKYIILPTGTSYIQVRAKAPLADPRFAIDVVYTKYTSMSAFYGAPSALPPDSVKLSFRAFDVMFLKAPRLGAGCKVPIHFASGVKSTIRVKKYLLDDVDGTDQYEKRKKAAPRGRPPAAATAAEPEARARWFEFGAGHVNNHVAPAEARARRVTAASSRAQPGAVQPRRKVGLFGPAGVDIKMRLLEIGGDE
jgi:hypothetical protein